MHTNDLLSDNSNTKSEISPIEIQKFFDAIDRGNIDYIEQEIIRVPNIVHASHYGSTPLHFASAIWYGANWRKIVSTLLKNGASPKDKDCGGRTALHIAVQNSYELIDELIQYGADINARDNCLNTPLSLASKRHFIEGVQSLIKHGANVNSLNNEGYSPLWVAVGYSEEEIAKLLIENGADTQLIVNNNSMLHLAIARLLLDIVKIVIEKGADVNALTLGKSPLCFAVEGGHYNSAKIITIIRLLIQNGADVNYKDAEGNTLLHIACASKAGSDVISELIINSVDASAQNNHGQTALDILLGEEPNYQSVKSANLLIQHDPHHVQSLSFNIHPQHYKIILYHLHKSDQLLIQVLTKAVSADNIQKLGQVIKDISQLNFGNNTDLAGLMSVLLKLISSSEYSDTTMENKTEDNLAETTLVADELISEHKRIPKSDNASDNNRGEVSKVYIQSQKFMLNILNHFVNLNADEAQIELQKLQSINGIFNFKDILAYNFSVNGSANDGDVILYDQIAQIYDQIYNHLVELNGNKYISNDDMLMMMQTSDSLPLEIMLKIKEFYPAYCNKNTVLVNDSDCEIIATTDTYDAIIPNT